MCSTSCARSPYVDIEASLILLNAPMVFPVGFRKAVRLFAVVLTSATLAACAQPSVVNNKSELLAASRQTSNLSFVTNRRVAFITKQNTLFASGKHAAETKNASYGLASFYAEGTKTASGEKFDPHDLTAAHPTLPFGTRLRVTNVATGRTVIVRVNDRGPFIPGRVVDVSYSAAATLGIIGRGIAKVKLDVVQ